jgi:hypothetical protein
MKKGFEPLYLRVFKHYKFQPTILFHYVPATRSRTATLLRLHPNYQSLNRFD